MNAEATRLWAKFFSSGNTAHLNISIPVDWANFFTVQLLSPVNFNWIKLLLSSKITPLLSTLEHGSIEFSIPPSCPENNLTCLADPGDDDWGIGSSKDIPPKKRATKVLLLWWSQR